VVHRRLKDGVARPDEKQSPGGFETSSELRRTPEPRGRRRGVLIAAAVVIAVLAVAVVVYLAL
jgi:hypothetical protein